MSSLGYQREIERLGLRVMPLDRPAAIRSVTRIEELSDVLAVPANLAPRDTTLDHLLFALKHEGTNLQVLAVACRHLEASALLTELRRTPTGGYIRLLCFLWEQFSGEVLEDLPAGLGGVTRELFDSQRYVTSGPVRRDRRWRILNNGLGDWSFCPTVRRTPDLLHCLAADPLAQARAFLAKVPESQIERVLAWAYLHETRSSYEIEGESPTGSKAEAFAALLRQAHERHEISEGYLVELQNAAVTNPYVREASFRHTQNYLSDGAPGARGVSYVPPPADMIPSMIEGIGRLANGALCSELDPLLRAALVSFGFVFVHPFSDGNGRLSRFLAHYALCQSGALPDGLILPLSTAMKRNEQDYLKALQSFSRPARRLWNVQWLDGPDFKFEFLGDPAIYRYWDATECVTFLARMALDALRTDLSAEVEFLACYDEVVRKVNEQFDVPGSTLSKLIVMAYQNGGRLSRNRRRQFAERVGPQALDYIEAQVLEALQRASNASPASS